MKEETRRVSFNISKKTPFGVFFICIKIVSFSDVFSEKHHSFYILNSKSNETSFHLIIIID